MDPFFRIMQIFDAAKPGDPDYAICLYLFRNLEKIKGMTVEEIATATSNSPSSVIRFAQKMKYENFSDFKISFFNALHTFAMPSLYLPPYRSGNGENPFQRMASVYREKFDELESAMKDFAFDEVVELYHSADKVSFYLSHINPIFNCFRFDLARGGRIIKVFNDFKEQLENVKTLTENSLATVILFPNRHELVNESELLNAIKKQGAKLFLISTMPAPSFANYADYFVTYKTETISIDMIVSYVIIHSIAAEYQQRFIRVF